MPIGGVATGDMGTTQLEFDSDVERRVYEYVEARGAAAREEVRDAVRVEETPGAKPPRSGTESATRLSVPACNEHIDELLDDGALAERDGTLYVSPDAGTDRHETDEFEYVVRPADERDRAAVADLIRSVAAEGAIVVDERVADAVEPRSTNRRTRSDAPTDREGALIRLNDRESRMFFVAEIPGEEDAADETIGWVNVHGFELPAREHTAELTVGVAPEYREQGVGGVLLERGIAWADDAGCLKVYQSIPATNEEALDLLETHGWEREATRADHYRIDGELVDEVQLATRLDESD